MLTLKTEWGKKIITTEIITSVCASGHSCEFVWLWLRLEYVFTKLQQVCVCLTAKRSCVLSMGSGQSASMLLTHLPLKHTRKTTKKGQRTRRAAMRYELLNTVESLHFTVVMFA